MTSRSLLLDLRQTRQLQTLACFPIIVRSLVPNSPPPALKSHPWQRKIWRFRVVLQSHHSSLCITDLIQSDCVHVVEEDEALLSIVNSNLSWIEFSSWIPLPLYISSEVDIVATVCSKPVITASNKALQLNSVSTGGIVHSPDLTSKIIRVIIVMLFWVSPVILCSDDE